MAEGRRITVSAKVSEDDAALIDARCAASGLTRSAWLQSLVAASLAGVAEGRPVLRMRVRADPGMPAGTAALASPGRHAVAVTGLGSAECPPHPKARVIKGMCGACGTGGLS